MPELQFIGKEFVYNHHLTVPYRPLVIHPDKSVVAEGDSNGASLDDNLIIQGDNLHALKALLPRYAGKVDCIFIDPPYNTGNEGWGYNDNVNSPLMREWLKSNPVNLEDMMRHDKWCAMMWPRLRLIWELLSESGCLWICLDDHEAARAKILLDEIAGEDAFIAMIPVVNNLKGRNDKEHVALTHEYLLLYAKPEFQSRGLPVAPADEWDDEATDASEESEELRDLRKRGHGDRQEDRPKMHFPIFWNRATGKVSLERSTDSIEILPIRGDGSPGRWRWGHTRVGANLERLRPRQGASGRYDIDYVVELARSADGRVRKKPKSFWQGSALSTDSATSMIKDIFGKNPLDHAPKPLAHVKRCIDFAAGPESLVLDSFAGSATTAHAVLSLNAEDCGNRRFILVEMQSYADEVTAGRVRRVIGGYPFKGTIRETLFEKKLTWTTLQKIEQIMAEAKQTAQMHEGNFDTIETKVDVGTLKVIGIRKVEERAPGLGGGFTYCTLGDPLDIDKILTGDQLPSFENIAGWLVHTAFGTTLPSVADNRGEGLVEWYVGETDTHHVWVMYRPDRAWLQSRDASLTLTLAEQMAKKHGDKPHQVFAPAKFVGKVALDALKPRVEFAPLPFALYRLERGS